MTGHETTTGFLRVSGTSTRRLVGDVTRDVLAPGSGDDLSPAEVTARLFTDLQGTWAGRLGFNVIAVPGPGSTPTAIGDFQLLPIPYTELLSFVDPGAPARNRGGDVDQFVAALEYRQRVTDATNDQLLHVETGMFLNLSTIVENGTTDPRPVPARNVARSGTIPHGDSVLLLGPPPTITSGPPEIPDTSAIPTNLGPNVPDSYTDPYRQPVAGADVINPNAMLRTALVDQRQAGIEVVETTTFGLDSQPDGSVANVPYVVARANATRVQATFWLEKVHDTATGQEFEQLQYSQVVDLAFHHNSPDPATGLITWPHITVNTLVKQ